MATQARLVRGESNRNDAAEDNARWRLSEHRSSGLCKHLDFSGPNNGLYLFVGVTNEVRRRFRAVKREDKKTRHTNNEPRFDESGCHAP
jgi:hypothetical protein